MGVVPLRWHGMEADGETRHITLLFRAGEGIGIVGGRARRQHLTSVLSQLSLDSDIRLLFGRGWVFRTCCRCLARNTSAEPSSPRAIRTSESCYLAPNSPKRRHAAGVHNGWNSGPGAMLCWHDIVRAQPDQSGLESPSTKYFANITPTSLPPAAWPLTIHPPPHESALMASRRRVRRHNAASVSYVSQRPCVRARPLMGIFVAGVLQTSSLWFFSSHGQRLPRLDWIRN